jgi:glycosyltransferase involved in cell wall biosynthesis
MPIKLPISAIVVGLNEGQLLRCCLPALTACDEILYFDLGSTDDSIAVARRFGATVIEHPRVACCEEIHASHAHRTKNEWVLITDPDEVISPELMTELASVFATGRLHPGIGAVMAPWIFYFGQRALRGTPWGGLNRRVLWRTISDSSSPRRCTSDERSRRDMNTYTWSQPAARSSTTTGCKATDH